MLLLHSECYMLPLLYNPKLFRTCAGLYNTYWPKPPQGLNRRKLIPLYHLPTKPRQRVRGEVQIQYRRHWKPTISYKRFWWVYNYWLTKLKAPIPSLTPPSNSWKNCCSTLFFWSICRIERHSLDWKQKLEHKFIMTLKMIKSNFTLSHHTIMVIDQNSRKYLSGCCCVEFNF